jgi:(p)ppGpp synthase/HD superfamily hydrolase
MPEKTETPLLSPKFALALQFANQIHGKQVRKGIGAPYISHLMAVSALVLEFGGTENQAIAALLHDAAEDCGGRKMLETVRVMFGDEVADIVEACTDSFAENPEEKLAWRPRKEGYLARLADEPPAPKLVSCADKFHNLTNTLRDIENEGVEAWKARMAMTMNGAAEKQLWYYGGCLESLSAGWNDPILGCFASAVGELRDALGEEG